MPNARVKRSTKRSTAARDPQEKQPVISYQVQALPGSPGSRSERASIRLHRPQAEEAQFRSLSDCPHLGRRQLNNFSYSQLIQRLKKAGIELDRRSSPTSPARTPPAHHPGRKSQGHPGRESKAA